MSPLSAADCPEKRRQMILLLPVVGRRSVVLFPFLQTIPFSSCVACCLVRRVLRHRLYVGSPKVALRIESSPSSGVTNYMSFVGGHQLYV